MVLIGGLFMFKKLLLCLVTLCFMSITVFASPLTDYNQGKTAIDVNLYPSSDFHGTNNVGYNKYTKGKSGNYDWGITTGIGNKFALQIRQFNPQTIKFTSGSTYEQIKINTEEFNVLYQIGDRISVFAGYHQASVGDDFSGHVTPSKKNRNAQFGMTGSTKIVNKTHFFGTVGVGSEFTNYEVGLAYDVNPSIELNILYRDKKVKDITYEETIAAVEFKGLGYGITYKF